MPRSTSNAEHSAEKASQDGLELPEHFGEDEPGHESPPDFWELENAAPQNGGSAHHARDPNLARSVR